MIHSEYYKSKYIFIDSLTPNSVKSKNLKKKKKKKTLT